MWLIVLHRINLRNKCHRLPALATRGNLWTLHPIRNATEFAPDAKLVWSVTAFFFPGIFSNLMRYSRSGPNGLEGRLLDATLSFQSM
jgi:hypothetical protein